MPLLGFPSKACKGKSLPACPHLQLLIARHVQHAHLLQLGQHGRHACQPVIAQVECSQARQSGQIRQVHPDAHSCGWRPRFPVLCKACRLQQQKWLCLSCRCCFVCVDQKSTASRDASAAAAAGLRNVNHAAADAVKNWNGRQHQCPAVSTAALCSLHPRAKQLERP